MTRDAKQVQARFGELVRKRRKAQGWSQEKLGENAGGLHRTYISSFECGRRNVSLLNIVKLADAFGITASELLEGL